MEFRIDRDAVAQARLACTIAVRKAPAPPLTPPLNSGRKTLRAACAAFACAAFACAALAPALAVDRSLGAGVPKPVATGAAWTEAEIGALDANIDIALATGTALRGAHAGVYAIDARDGRVLYQRNQDDAFQPASALKLLVGSAALDKLGPDFRFRTIAYPGGDVVDGVVLGYLMLRGSGDVLLDDQAFADLPDALRAAGITAVHGVSFDERGRMPRYLPGWSWDDLPWYYAAPVTQLGLNDNQVTLRVVPGAAAGARVTVTVDPWGDPCYPDQSCNNHSDMGFAVRILATTGAPGSDSTLDVVRTSIDSGWPDVVTLVGTLAAGAKPEHLSIAVPYPPRYAAHAASRALVAAGFRVLPDVISRGGGPARDEPKAVWTHDSEPLREMVADLWMPSDNVLAEQLLRALGAKAPALQGTTADGIAFEKSWLKGMGVDVDGLAISDGSGLSTYDRITPRDLVTVLKHDWDGPYRDLVLDDLPVAGVRGTLKSAYIGTPAEKKIFAKTGSVSHVSALAGYAANAKHGAVIFAFLVDDWVGESAALRDLRARVLTRFVQD